MPSTVQIVHGQIVINKQNGAMQTPWVGNYRQPTTGQHVVEINILYSHVLAVIRLVVFYTMSLSVFSQNTRFI